MPRVCRRSTDVRGPAQARGPSGGLERQTGLRRRPLAPRVGYVASLASERHKEIESCLTRPPSAPHRRLKPQ